MGAVKLVEYVHEYDRPVKDYKTNETRYISHVKETYYALGTGDNYESTNEDGNWDTVEDIWDFQIDGTTLTVSSRKTVLAYIGLLTKLLDEFPEDNDA